MSSSIAEQQGQGSRLRTPYFSVMLNQTDLLTGFESFEVTNTGHFTADTFTLTAAIDKLPFGFGPDYWGSAAGDELEIFAGFREAGAAQSLIYGQVDQVDIDLPGRTMQLTGRDLSARFLDNRTAEHFQDQTASSVVETLAARRGLKANAQDTTQRVGTYYELLNLGLTKDMTEWDFLTLLAQHEDFDLWVSGQTLNFQPPPPDNSDPYLLRWTDDGSGNRTANFEGLRMTRSETLAKDITVQVLSWNQAQATTVTATAKRNQANKNQRAGGTGQLYTFHPPNLNKQQADNYAASKLEDITKHERVIEGRLPGDSLLTNRTRVKLTGTNTSWDQLYYIETVSRKVAQDSGYGMHFRAKNHTTASTV